MYIEQWLLASRELFWAIRQQSADLWVDVMQVVDLWVDMMQSAYCEMQIVSLVFKYMMQFSECNKTAVTKQNSGGLDKPRSRS
jgi:hypothetical protein